MDNKYTMEYTMEQIFADRKTRAANQMESAINLAEILEQEEKELAREWSRLSSDEERAAFLDRLERTHKGD